VTPHSSTGRGRNYFYAASVANNRARPFRAANDFAIERDSDAPLFDSKSREKCLN